MFPKQPGQKPIEWSKSPVDIVREYFPSASDDDAGWLLWNVTGWPCFWDGDPEQVMRRQLQAFKDNPVEALAE